MASEYETVACPGCDCPDSELHCEVEDRFRTVPGETFKIVRCQACGLLFLNPRPVESAIGPYYAAEGYDPFASAEDSSSLAARLYKLARPLSIRRKAARVVQNLPDRVRALDVGCATGEFMIELRRRGFESFGVEPDARSAEFARQRHGLTVWTGGIENAPSAAGPFGLISFWHVLEHVHRLKDNLRTARDLLSATGQVAIAVPNPGSYDARAYGPNWVAWDSPRHLYHFEPAVMVNLLNESGFQARRAGAVAFDAFYHCLMSEQGGVGGLIRGGMRGLISYLRGISGHDGSSELYIATKK